MNPRSRLGPHFVYWEAGERSLVQVIVSDNESFEDALKRFNKGVMREGILKEARRRAHYEKPSEKRKRIEAARVRKLRKKLRRERQRAAARR